MSRVSKDAILYALLELETIHDLAAESFNGPAAAYRYHADSASRQIATLKQAGRSLPDWIERNASHLRAMGWRF